MFPGVHVLAPLSNNKLLLEKKSIVINIVINFLLTNQVDLSNSVR